MYLANNFQKLLKSKKEGKHIVYLCNRTHVFPPIVYFQSVSEGEMEKKAIKQKKMRKKRV